MARRLVKLYLVSGIGVFAVIGLASVVGLSLKLIVVPGDAHYPKLDHPTVVKVLEASGREVLLSDLMTVDPGHAYSLSGWFRTQSDAPRTDSVARISLGIQAFDETRTPLADGRAYRYPGATGNVVTRLDGWTFLQGVIQGEAKAGQWSFPVGTRFVRVVALPSAAVGVRTEIADVVFAPVLDLTPRDP